MANARSANVLVVDTTAAFSVPIRICGIKYEAGSDTPSVTIKADSASGTVIYYVDGANDTFDQVKIKSTGGIHVTIAGTGTKAYIYTE
jgi:hypothetical protein